MRTFGRIAIVILVVALAAGIGFGIWDAGYDQGLIDGADSTAEIIVQERRGFSPFGFIFGFFLLLVLFKLIFGWFGWRRWSHHKGYGPGGYRAHMEDRMSRWHDEAHGGTRGDEARAEPPSPIT